MSLSWITATALVTAFVSYRILRGMRPMPSVAGRRVVIVGASSGIGRSMALQYAQRGAHLLLCARRKRMLDQVVEDCQSVVVQPGTVHAVAGDITDRDTQIALRDRAMELWDGMVDYLVLNAGMISVRQVADLWDIDVATDSQELPPISVDRACADRADGMMRQMMDINLHAPVTVAGLFLPMLAHAKGCIVVISSMAALVAAPTRSLYTASKQAASGYFNALRMEIGARLGVAVTIAYPGTVDTDLRQSAVDSSPCGDAEASASAVGSQSGKMSPNTCARQIIRAAALRERELVTPLPYRISVALYALAPSLVEHMAKKKYGL
ncbi:hypothetical protein EV175_003740 [Coemansia sp. RSA 1933]|nr:hypothetical protein EV175_003740 [Coemansia sp. RSA 1933]